jgi:hypothetical protein
MRLGVIAAAAAAGIAGLAATPLGAQPPLRALTITPALAEGFSYPGQRIGPFTILNTTGERYAVRALPVLIGQRFDGSLFVRQDPVSRARARRFIELVDRAHFPLASGEARSVSSTLRSDPPRRDFYGGVLFEGAPSGALRGSRLRQVLQLNARIALRPPPAFQSVRARLTEIAAEQAGPRRLRYLVRLANTGNVDVRPKGVLRVLDSSGAVRFGRPLRRLQVLPGFAVDLPAAPARVVLPAGRYILEARVRVGKLVLRKRESMRLFGPNEAATRRAKIVGLVVHDAYIGHEARVQVDYRNLGNVFFAPAASLRASDGQEASLATEAVAPGKEGRATGKIEFSGTGSRDVTVRLRADGRELDRRTISVTPVERPPLRNRLQNWIVEHALLLVGALAALVAALLATVATLLVRRQPA